MKLSYLNPETTAEGMRIFPLQLESEGARIAPFSSSRFTLEPGCSSVEERHHVSEMWIVVEGSGRLLHDGRPARLETGQAVYFGPWEPHQAHNDGVSRLVVLSFWW